MTLIDGATGPTYTLQPEDEGWLVWCEVTLSNGVGSDATDTTGMAGPVARADTPEGAVEFAARAVFSPAGSSPAKGAVTFAARAVFSPAGERPEVEVSVVGPWSDPIHVDTEVALGGFGNGPFGQVPFGGGA